MLLKLKLKWIEMEIYLRRVNEFCLANILNTTSKHMDTSHLYCANEKTF